MELSLLVAKITAVLYASAAVGAFFGKKHYQKMIDDLFGNAGLTFLTGFMALILGFLLVHFHNVWVKNWTVLITIIGWLALIKGVMIIAFPEFVRGYSAYIFKRKGFALFPWVAAAMALLFGYFGFLA